MQPQVADRVSAVADTARAHADEVDAAGSFPAAAVAALRESGLTGLTIPESRGGLGASPLQFAAVVSEVAAACGSTAMILLMHVSAAMAVQAAPPPGWPDLPAALADGSTLATLAFSERGSRSHFWVPMSRAVDKGDHVHLEADKSWVTSAGEADLYVLSCLAPGGAGDTGTNLYAVPAATPGLSVAGTWSGLGLRGNASAPMTVDADLADGLRLGADGAGLDLVLGAVLPWFQLGNAAVTLGLARAAVSGARSHVTSARLEHLDETLADLPTVRQRIARAWLSLSAHEAYMRETAARMAEPDDETLLHVLGMRAAANDAALTITDECMRVCGGAAFSRHLPVERAFRDVRAGHVMAPTSDGLYDFVGRGLCGMDIF